MAAWRAWILHPLEERESAAFEAALPLLTRPPERLPRARMSWLLGVAHARAGRRANAVRLMEGACAGYAAIGAAGMVALVMADLKALSGTLPESRLTGAERRVAVAVADGLSNKEAADQLFVSVKTVEFHLGNIFRKLDVRNRTELAGRRSTFD